MPTGISLPKIGASPDTNIEVNSVPETTVPAGSTVDFRLEDSVGNTVVPTNITTVGTIVTAEVPSGGGGAPVGATLMKTGQTTSYRTGDDGDFEAGRAVDFFTLASNNPFGNTDRFTDELGGQTYTNNIVIDWSTYDGTTVLGWRRTDNGVNITWDNAIDGALAVSIGSFTTGWRLPNINELYNLINRGATIVGNYTPFTLLPTNIAHWSSTSRESNTGVAECVYFNGGVCDGRGKGFNTASLTLGSGGMRYIPCRTFTVTGTTLT
jgi:hypothetical protein